MSLIPALTREAEVDRSLEREDNLFYIASSRLTSAIQ